MEDVEAPKEKPVKALDAPEGGVDEKPPDVGARGIWGFGELVRQDEHIAQNVRL